jgi:flagellar biosynthesis/type III secretory pathway M-ring protein FliF/YscJ
MTEGKTEYFPQNLKEQETVVTMPYAIRKVTATVGIPRSYIVSLYQARHPEAEEPTDVDLKADREAQVARVKNTVVKIVMGDPSDVTVDVYPDMKWDTGGPSWELTPSGMPKGESMTASATTVEMLRGYGPQVGLGVLALVGMFMMMRMVRKSASLVPEITGEAVGEGEEDIHGDRILSVGPHPVGEAERSDGMLTGHEVDEQTLIDRQLGEELTRMVEGDPSTAAELVKRWVEEED